MFLKLSQFQMHRFNFNINNTRFEEQSVKKKLLQNLKAIIGIFILNSFIPIKPRFDIKNTPTLFNCTILYEESSARIPPRKKKKKRKLANSTRIPNVRSSTNEVKNCCRWINSQFLFRTGKNRNSQLIAANGRLFQDLQDAKSRGPPIAQTAATVRPFHVIAPSIPPFPRNTANCNVSSRAAARFVTKGRAIRSRR